MNKQYLDGSVECSIFLAEYAIAITNGDDATEFFESIKPYVNQIIENNGESDTSQIEILNIMLPAYRALIARCAQESEYQLVKSRCLDTYSDFDGAFIQKETIGVFLDYIWKVVVKNQVVPEMFTQLINAVIPMSPSSIIKKYVLLTALHVLMGVSGYSNAAIKPTIEVIIAQLKLMDKITLDEFSSEKQPNFLA